MSHVLDLAIFPFTNPTPSSHRGRKRLKEFGYNVIGLLGLAAIVLSGVVLFVINPFTEFVEWVDMFVVFVTILLMSGLFLTYATK